jgi:hypothetical protein
LHDLIVLSPAFGGLTHNATMFVPHPQAFDFLVDDELAEAARGVSRRIPDMRPTHGLGGTVIAPKLRSFRASAPQKFPRKFALAKVKVIVDSLQVHASAKHVQSRPCSENITWIEAQPRTSDEIGVLHACHEPKPRQLDESLFASASLYQLVAQMAHLTGTLEHEPLMAQVNASARRTEN